MCKLCDTFNFGGVFIGYNRVDGPYISYPVQLGRFYPNQEKFKFCPLCGRPLTEKNFQKRHQHP